MDDAMNVKQTYFNGRLKVHAADAKKSSVPVE
jgi:hypothetical protein